jgi:transcriptional regulator with XRE-family HTH domain
MGRADKIGMEGLGGRLRARARELGWSDAEVARRVGLGQTRYAGYVLDQHEPDLATLLRICATLGVSVAGLLGEIEGGPIGEAALRDRVTAGMGALDPEALKALAIVTDGLVARSARVEPDAPAFVRSRRNPPVKG